jgi:hypothetical protein
VIGATRRLLEHRWPHLGSVETGENCSQLHELARKNRAKGRTRPLGVRRFPDKGCMDRDPARRELRAEQRAHLTRRRS